MLMVTSEQESFACENGNDRTAVIQMLNDTLRCTGVGGQTLVTQGILALGRTGVGQVMKALKGFEAFNTDNDPYGEHDFGKIITDGHEIFWKIDYFDSKMMFGSPDPADPSVTQRLITIMLASEY
jgi:hypothetical protein